MSVTPVQGLATEVITGGQAVTAIPANPNGGIIMNPPSAPENLYVNPVGAASPSAGGSNFEIPPGGVWNVIPGQTTPTSVNAPSNNHEFSAIYW